MDDFSFNGGTAEFFKVRNSPPASPGGSSGERDGGIYIGSLVDTLKGKGVVKYIGKVDYCRKKKVYVGVELESSSQERRHDGTVKGKTYFIGKPGHCIMCSPKDVRLHENSPGKQKENSCKQRYKSVTPPSSPSRGKCLGFVHRDVQVDDSSRTTTSPANVARNSVVDPSVDKTCKLGIAIGTKVMVYSQFEAIVKYVGPVDYCKRKEKLYVGVETVHEEHGVNDGVIKGRRYFECKQGYGRMCALSDVEEIDQAAK